MNINSNDYWSEVNSLAASIVAEAAKQTDCDTLESFDADTIRDAIYDTVLHETIDGHQWVIYYGYNLDVLQHSDNAEYGINEGLIDANDRLSNGGLSGLHSALAYWALYTDVNEKISDALDSFEESLAD